MESTTQYKGFKEILSESTPKNLPIYQTSPQKKYFITIPLLILCIIFGWHFFDIFSIKLHQNANDHLGYYNYSLLHLFSILFLSFPTMYLIEIDVSIALILSCVLEIISSYFSYLIRYRILIEFSVFTSIIAMTLFFKSIGKICQLWHSGQEKNLILFISITFIFFGAGISFLTYNKRAVEWGKIKRICSIIKITSIIPCLGLLINPYPEKFISERQYERYTHKDSISNQIYPCFILNWQKIFSISLIISSYVFIFLSHVDPQENMLRAPGFLIGFFFILSICFILLIYFYFQKFANYDFLIKVILLTTIATYFLIFFSIFVIRNKNFNYVPVFVMFFQFIMGLCMVLFIIISYDYICDEGHPYGESIIISICEIIVCISDLFLLSINYYLRTNIFFKNERFVEIIIFIFPFITGCFLLLPNIEGIKVNTTLADLNKLSIIEETNE